MRASYLKIITLVIGLWLVARCGKVTEGTSFLMSSKDNFPVCNSDREGYLAYATDEEQFYTCDGETWRAVSIQGPPGTDGDDGSDGSDGSHGDDANTVHVYDANGNALGIVVFATWPAVAIRFGSGNSAGVGLFKTDGAYDNSVCKDSFCSPAVLATDSALFASNVALLFATMSASQYSRSYCGYSTTDCSGSCYVMGQPLKNGLFRNGTSSWVKSSGSESTASVTMNSLFVYDASSCTTLATGSGVCCNNLSIATGSAYGVSTSYTFPTGTPSYPFTGPLYFE